MNNNDINTAWAAVVPLLRMFGFYDIKDIVGLTGFDRNTLLSLGEDRDSYGKFYNSAERLVEQIDEHFLRFSDEAKLHFLNIVIEEILSGNHNINSNFSHQRALKKRLQYYLERLGWQLIDKKVLPIDVLDQSDLKELDPSAREDLIKAAIKFRDGDLSGAIASACAAVDSVTANVFQHKNLGDPKVTSFQERCIKSLAEAGIFTAIDSQLSGIAWKQNDIKQFKENLKQSLNQAAYVMQTLRSNMSDVHGTKPVVRSLAFDSIKWAQIFVRLLSQN